MAVLQIHSHSDEEENRQMLLAEGQVLALVQYFLDSFYKRARAENVKNLPGMHRFGSTCPRIAAHIRPVISCNTAFVGKLCDDVPLTNRKGALLHRSFLVAPYIDTDGAEEAKFSGNDDFHPNDDALGLVVEAFTHHAFADSGETFLPADLQGTV